MERARKTGVDRQRRNIVNNYIKEEKSQGIV